MQNENVNDQATVILAEIHVGKRPWSSNGKRRHPLKMHRLLLHQAILEKITIYLKLKKMEKRYLQRGPQMIGLRDIMQVPKSSADIFLQAKLHFFEHHLYKLVT